MVWPRFPPSISLDSAHSFAYACVDMHYQHRIHALGRRLWPRCTNVELKDGLLHCELARDRQYDLIDAYCMDPHMQFLNCKTIADLRSFTRPSGPLYLDQTLANTTV